MLIGIGNRIGRLGAKLKPLIATLTATGNGTGVSTLRMQVDETQTFSLSGSARFYTDAAGTTGESTTWTVTSGALRTIYLRCPSGVSQMVIPKPDKVINWGNSATDGWTSATNAGQIGIEVGKLRLSQLRLIGNSTIMGALPTGLTFLRLSGTNWTYSGALPTGLTYLYLSGTNWTYSGALPTGLTYLYLLGTNINWTYSGALPTGLIFLHLSGTNINWTYSGALPTGLTFLHLTGNNINWTYSGALPTGLTYLYLSGTNWTYSGALPTGLTYLYLLGTNINWTGLDFSGTGNITTFSLLNFRIAKLTSPEMVTSINSLTNRVGALPSTVTINDYADYLNPPQSVIDAVNALKLAKNITTVNLGA